MMSKPVADMSNTKLLPFAPNIWVKDYPIRYSGCAFFGRMTVIKLEDGRIILHSPCDIDNVAKAEIDDLGGTVAFIVAPGTYHYLHVESCQRAFPLARTYVCPGLEAKRPDLRFDGVLGDQQPPDGDEGWGKELDQVVVKGCRFIWEVAFFHRSTRTLILVDIVENIGDQTPGTNWILRFFWKYVVFMWNNPKVRMHAQQPWRSNSS
uniref:DUF4336 domain-containing protein n=1 Tax=Odontella aurita TaxID=265563 RepID=A0A7S4INA2_9STRA|mmetsp:Transcript_27699/g.81388  ORF Transcript_27699/g.81388 Transcript_27699/m.81388 type:complete len:207 (+) Transcript_27699:653-1273(+)